MKKSVSIFSYMLAILIAIALINYGVNVYKTGILINSPTTKGVIINVGEYAVYFSTFFIVSGIWLFYLTFSTYKKYKL